MQKTCDMHIHTDNSDGILSGTALLQRATECNLNKLVVTDHDCVDFYLDKDVQAKLKDYDYMTGCEFVCTYGDIPIEMLGYGIDVKETKKYLDKYGITENRIERYRSEQTPKVFAKYGIVLDYDPKSIDFSQKCPMVLEKLHEVILQSPEAVRFLYMENPNLIKSVSAFLREGLNNPASKIFIAPHKLYPSFEKIAALIKKVGGLTFLAHPYQYGENMERVLEGVKNHVDGIECYHYTTMEKEKVDHLKAFCKANNLMISGGSDYHKPDASGIEMLNKLGVPAKYFDEIKARISTKQKQM